MVELRRKRQKLELSPTLWVMSLELARLSGWMPHGTVQVGWPMDYFASSGQTVSAEDAADLADALERAETVGQKAIEDWQAGRSEPPVKMRTPAPGFRWFQNPLGREHLQRLIKFCRRGEFQIE